GAVEGATASRARLERAAQTFSGEIQPLDPVLVERTIFENSRCPVECFVFIVGEIGNLAEVSVFLQTLNDLREGYLTLSFDHINVCAHIIERRFQFVALIVSGVIGDQWSSDDDLDLRIMASNELH